MDGKNTKSENLADIGGIKIAYLAYRDWLLRQNIPEPKLPGLFYTSRQMFWISAANAWCEKSRPQYLMQRIIRNYHTIYEYRIIGSFSNMPEFAIDFNCPVGTNMNPPNKCTVW